jgi:hypothetical protein
MGGFQGTLGGFANFLGGPWGIALGTAATVIGAAFIENIPQAAKNVDELRGSLDQATGALTKMTEASVIQALQQSGALDAAKKFGVNLKDVVKAAEGDVDASKRVADQMNKVQDAANRAADANSNLSGKANALRGDYNTLAQAIGGQTAAVKDAVNQQQNWLQATGASKNAQDAVKQSLDQFNSTLATNGVVTDQSSAAYQSNLLALNTLGGKAKDYITTVQNQTHSVNETTAAQGSMISQLYNSARQMGMNSAEADKYVGKLLGIPTERVTTLRLDNSQALNAIANTAAALQRMQALANAGASVVVRTNVGKIANENGGIVRTGAQAFANGGMRAYAAGGLATGIYAARNPGVIKFAEPATRWEAYISGKPGQETRNIGIALQALKKLGVDPSAFGSQQSGPVNVTNHLYGVDPQVTADLIQQGMLAAFGW